MLRPFLIVGVGGSGGKTLRAVKQAIELRLQQAGWDQGWPDAWQFLHVDSPVVQDGESFPAPFLPPAWYAGLVAAGNNYSTVYDAAVGGLSPSQRLQIEKALPSKHDADVKVTSGAGQFRAIGRTIALSRLEHVQAAASAAIARLTSAGASSQLESLSRVLGIEVVKGEVEPIALIVSSVAGGSGAGQFIDVAEAVKSASAGAIWLDDITAILYAPDVFDEVGGPGVPPNALAALAETMAGLWRRDLLEETDALYKSKRVNARVGPNYNIGPKYSFVVGRDNGTVRFPSQTDVYLAVAAAISTWMTDRVVQDSIEAYTKGNYQASATEAVLPDFTRFKIPNIQAPPFMSLGVGRVGLGRDRFGQYCAERLAREGLDRMLYQHLTQDPNLQQKTESEWIEDLANIAYRQFVKDSGLDELSESNNDVVDAIRPDRTALSAQLRSAILTVAQQGIDPKTGGQSITGWQNLILAGLQANQRKFLELEAVERSANLRRWVETIPEQIILTVSRSMAQNGIAVTSELVNRLEQMLKQAVAELRNEANVQTRYASEVSSYVGQMLQQASGQDAPRVDHPAVSQAVDQAVNGFLWAAEADLKETCSELLDDVATNLVSHLRRAVMDASRVLKEAAGSNQTPDGRPNPYSDWPIGTIVPRKFSPPENERLLVQASEYPAEFERLVASAVEQKQKSNALSAVLDQVLLGELLVEDLHVPWRLLTTEQVWIPRQTEAKLDPAAAPQPARYSISADLDEYRNRAFRWLSRSGTTFGAYLSQDLRTYLTDQSVGAAELSERNNLFQQELSSALAASAPLVKLNIALLNHVHRKAKQDFQVIVSKIPFAVGSAQYSTIKNSFVAKNYWPLNEGQSDKWFDAGAITQHIDLFTILDSPVQAVVMDSVVRPIAELWNKVNATEAARQGFWQWRRARPLPEFIPVAPAVLKSMLRGWYAAKLLGLLDAKIQNPTMGPQLAVRGADGRLLEFPYPLLFNAAAPAHDYPGLVMKSLVLTLPMCHTQGSLDPLNAYHRLMDLGGKSDEQAAQELQDWILHSVVAHNSISPKPERAGDKSAEWQARRDACVVYLKSEWESFQEQVLTIDGGIDPRRLPASWELRAEIEDALHALTDAIRNVRPVENGGV